MKDFKIGHITVQVELQQLDDNGEVVSRRYVPDKQGEPSMLIYGAVIPEDMKTLIFSRLKFDSTTNKEVQFEESISKRGLNMKPITYDMLVHEICSYEGLKSEVSVGNVREILKVLKCLSLKNKLVLIRYLFGAQND